MQSLKPIKKKVYPKISGEEAKLHHQVKGSKKRKKKSNTNVIIKINVSELATTQNP